MSVSTPQHREFSLHSPSFMPDSSPKSSNAVDRSRLDPILGPIVRAHGAEVVDVELRTERNGWILRVSVEKLGSAANKASTKAAAVDLDTCANIARELSPALDVVDVVPHRYNLEVGSPGVERVLRTRADFDRFSGEKAKLKLRVAQRGQKVLVGNLGPVKGETVDVSADGFNYEIPLSDIEWAHLVFDFGPAPPPSKRKKK